MMRLILILILSLFVFLVSSFADDVVSPSIDYKQLAKLVKKSKGDINELPLSGKTQKVKCFSGVSLFGGNRIEYEVFPELHLLRVRIAISAEPGGEWVPLVLPEGYGENLSKMPKDVLILPDEVRLLILSVGSGLVERDILSAELSCSSKKGYFLKTMKVKGGGFEEYVNVSVLLSIKLSAEDCLFKNAGGWQKLGNANK